MKKKELLKLLLEAEILLDDVKVYAPKNLKRQCIKMTNKIWSIRISEM
tara:strand:- start:258 stop:401 length:144 start_codon:yes stop_codon:yes gene_type:complete